MMTNMIVNNLLAQVDQYGQHFVLFDDSIDARTDGTQIKIPDYFIHMKNGNKRRWETAKVWEICVQWKDVSSTWNQPKDIKESYTVQMAEYAAENELVK